MKVTVAGTLMATVRCCVVLLVALPGCFAIALPLVCLAIGLLIYWQNDAKQSNNI